MEPIVPRKDPPYSTLIRLLVALYGSPEKRVFVASSEKFDAERWIIAIWARQWPRLRRSFRFCTLSLSDRSVSNAPFDLQVLPRRSNSNKRRGSVAGVFVDPEVPETDSQLVWARAATEDLAITGGTPFRSFLRRFAADAEVGRAAFASLAETWVALESDAHSPDFDRAVLAVKRSTSRCPSLLRHLTTLVATASLATPPPGKTAIKFLTQNLELLDKTHFAKKEAAGIARAIWTRDQRLIWPLFKAKDPDRKAVAVAATQLMDPAEAFKGAGGDPDIMLSIVAANPSLAANSDIWKVDPPMPEYIFREVQRHSQVGRNVTMSMLEAASSDFAERALKAFGADALEALLSWLDTGGAREITRLRTWIAFAADRRKLLLEALASGKARTILVLAAFAALIDYRHAPIRKGRDCWAIAVQTIGGDPLEGGLEFCAFLLTRGLGGVSPQSGTLIGLSFDPIHIAAFRSALDYEAWDLVRRELLPVHWRIDRDKCRRLRATVAKFFVDGDLPANEFLRITEDDKIFKLLVDSASYLPSGRKYLERILDESLSLTSPNLDRRLEILKAAI